MKITPRIRVYLDSDCIFVDIKDIVFGAEIPLPKSNGQRIECQLANQHSLRKWAETGGLKERLLAHVIYIHKYAVTIQLDPYARLNLHKFDVDSYIYWSKDD